MDALLLQASLSLQATILIRSYEVRISQTESDAFASSLSQKNMVLFRRNAAIAVYQSFTGFDPVSDRNSVDGTPPFFARLDALRTSATELLVEVYVQGCRVFRWNS